MISAEDQRKIFSDNLNRYLKMKGKIPADVARELDIPESTLRSWISGEKYPRIQNIQKLADYFNVRRSDITEAYTNYSDEYSELVKVPIIGEIACGEPILATENFDGYILEPKNSLPSGEVFYLRAKGDSMQPTIPNESNVLIRLQSSVEDGEIAAVLVNGDEEVTLKRIKYQDGIILLVADNSKYPPYIVTKNNPARIIGKALKFSVDL
ncbi:LexA family protein [Jeotgalibaca porci]|uniref:LexA family protein n=1 Tax=Jeotgalibaca porci TaxID=1868793 RepID=UPI00359FEA8F